MTTIRNWRILLVDDMSTIQDDFRKILVPQSPSKSEALHAEITERKHLETQLVQSEKLASIGMALTLAFQPWETRANG